MRTAGVAAAVLSLALTTVITAQTVSFDFDRSASFGSFKSYAWVKGHSVPDPLVDRRLVSAVDAQLTLKGMARVAPEARPDVFVAYHASFDKDLEIIGFGSGWGGYRFGGTRTASARAEQILVGTMIVDIVDARTKTIVWRGTATKDIDVNANPDKRDKNIAKTTEKLFKSYPPQAR